jgi:hypothetical protein
MLEKHLKPPSERKYSGIYTDSDIGVVMKYGRVGVNKYKDRQIMHEPMFLNALRTLIDYERPQYVLEFGSFQGGLTSFMSDTALIHGHNMRIISFDWDIYESPNQPAIPGAEFVCLDVFDINNYLLVNHELITCLEGTKLVIDDIGINTVDLFNAIDPYMKKGDHFVCCHTLDIENHDSLLNAASAQYAVNTMACDAFGENFIENPNGFLIKIS